MIFLYGAPASGKSTLGRALAERLGLHFVDLDERIVAEAGMTIPEIFKSRGEAVFRDIESKALKEVVSGLISKLQTSNFKLSTPTVVSLGGGTLLRDENRSLCEESGTVFCIDTPSDDELARRLGAAPGSRSSLVVVGRGIAPAVLAGRNVVADETVARLWSGRLGVSPFATIPSGEEHKTPVTVAKLWRAFAERGLGRRDAVAALGGGVTGDLTGFAAATWMRGIPWINVPTTLLSMVDASTGGKTGCDLPDGKNLAGAFHFPKLVVIDADFLETLSPKLVADGRAEMIKHEAIGGAESPELKVESCGLPSPREIAGNLMVKVGIVREDPLETKGRRILLNCGHTVAHAVEKATGYRVSHGEAVAMGCVEEARIAVRRGLAPAEWPDALASRFAAAGLPTTLPDGLSLDRLVPLMRGDKKREGDAVVFALPCGWGDVRGVRIDLSKESL